MITVTKQQANDRFDTLPAVLQDAIFSMAVNDEIHRICEANHLSREKASMVGRLAGRVLLGFIHDTDYSREIKEATGIDGRIAETIAAEIDKKIFEPVREDLKRVYRPSGSALPLVESSVAAGRQEEGGSIVWQERKFEPAQLSPETVIDLKNPAILSVQDRSAEDTREREKEEKEKQARAILAGGAARPVERSPQRVMKLEASLAAAAFDEAPVILHREELLTPAGTEKKRSLGGLMGFFGRSERKTSEPVRAEVDLGMSARSGSTPASGNELKSTPGSQPVTRSAAVPGVVIKHDGEGVTKSGEKIKIVHYGPSTSDDLAAADTAIKAKDQALVSSEKIKVPAISEAESIFKTTYTNPQILEKKKSDQPPVEKEIIPAATDADIIDLASSQAVEGSSKAEPPANLPVGDPMANINEVPHHVTDKVIDLSRDLSAGSGRLAKMFSRSTNNESNTNKRIGENAGLEPANNKLNPDWRKEQEVSRMPSPDKPTVPLAPPIPPGLASKPEIKQETKPSDEIIDLRSL